MSSGSNATYHLPLSTIQSRLGKHGLELDQRFHPDISSHQDFRLHKVRPDRLGFQLRHEELIWPIGTTPTKSGKGVQFRKGKVTPQMREDFAKAVEHTLGKRLANPEAADPRALVHCAWHATKNGEPVLFIDNESIPVNFAKLSEKQIGSYSELLPKKAKQKAS